MPFGDRFGYARLVLAVKIIWKFCIKQIWLELALVAIRMDSDWYCQASGYLWHIKQVIQPMQSVGDQHCCSNCILLAVEMCGFFGNDMKFIIFTIAKIKKIDAWFFLVV